MSDIEAAAKRLVDLRKCLETMEGLPPGERPGSLAEGYLIQDRVAELLGHRTVGWKLGATSAEVQRVFGLDGPLCGRLLEPFVQEYPATISIDEFAKPPQLECEVAFVLSDELPPTAGPFTAASVRAAIESIVPAIELVCSRFDPMTAVDGASLVADNVASGHLVTGEPMPFTKATKPSQVAATLRVDGEVMAKGSGDAVLGDPLEALAWLANHLAARGVALPKGSLITTGSMTGMVPIAPEDVAMADFGKLGRVSVHLSG